MLTLLMTGSLAGIGLAILIFWAWGFISIRRWKQRPHPETRYDAKTHTCCPQRHTRLETLYLHLSESAMSFHRALRCLFGPLLSLLASAMILTNQRISGPFWLEESARLERSGPYCCRINMRDRNDLRLIQDPVNVNHTV